MTPLQPLASPLAAPAKPQSAKLAEVAQQFGAIFVRQMLAAARKADFGGDDVLGGQGMETFRQMQDERFADIAAERGSFGMAKMIEMQLAETLRERPSTSSGRADQGLGSITNPAQPELVEGYAQTSGNRT